MSHKLTSLTTFFSLLLTLSTTAQIEITDNDLPESNQSYQVVNTASTDLGDYSSAGPDQMWDFSNLTGVPNEEVAFSPVSAAPFAYQFLFNNPFDEEHQATHTIEGDAIDLGVVSIDEFFFFYKKTSEQYNIVGYGGTVSGVPIPSQTNPIDVVYALPLNYGDTHNSFSAWNVEIPTLGSYFQEQQRDYEVDAWGTVITPNGSYDALRVRMTTNIDDSLYIETLSQGVTFNRVTVAYQWLALEEGIPVLEITESDFGGNTVRYKSDEEIPDNVANASGRQAVTVFPTVCTEYFSVQNYEGKAPIELYDLRGKMVRSFSGTTRCNVGGLPAGCYLVAIRDQDIRYTQRIMIQ